ncbi:hypothetical protein FWH30_02085, partial [Microgenomates group bacterium]|nr:hypothetical protein [Microgenomates group bacterium]
MNPAIALPLGFLLCSFFITGTFIIPFINLLYKLKFQRVRQKTVDPLGAATPIFDKFNQHKAGTPIGGGVLIILLVVLLFFLLFPLLKLIGFDVTSNYDSISSEIFIVFFTF